MTAEDLIRRAVEAQGKYDPDEIIAQAGLFDDRIFDVGLGEAQRDASIAQVEQAADERWLRLAETKVLEIARAHEHFTTDDVWASLAPYDISTHEPRALGAVMRDMAKRRIIYPTAQTIKSKRPECHRRDIRVWKSLLR